ncbi:MAG: ATP synthase F1 subunit gamma [Candidatus Kapabacteria bacterium]|nr:ATP synthase F1 subunit gamma [Candidatus Kapabacteria bacterium]MCS7169147.1 ATP synthase F1 subunit gamma [Candidatus Kapabacteria bacterium]MDW7996945.1 ATP synthase F1 subunit gamma [Bacteroidota bacterium]MDW8224854.1 ATP synthase F1 subunit gamma [Bacteroidota bacterium]
MATLRDIRRRIQAVRNTAKITAAMRMVSAAKLRRAQEAIWAARPYAQKLNEILTHLASTAQDFVHPFFEARKEIRSIALIVVTADRGLCGSFNNNVLRSAVQHISELEQQLRSASIHIFAVGRRGLTFFRKRAREPIAYANPQAFSPLRYETAQELARAIMESFLIGRYDRIEVLYNEFRSVLRQEVRHEVLLPIVSPEHVEKHRTGYIYEPSQADILNALLPLSVQTQIWRILLDSNTAEHAARMIAMENATTNAHELIRHLQLQYNKERQAAITKEMVEISSGAEALRGQG